MQNKVKIVLCISMVLLGLETVFAQSAIAPLTKFESWNITIVGVRTDNLDDFTPKQKNLVANIRPLIGAVVKEVDLHYFTTEEKYKARELKREDALSTLSNSLSQLLLKADTKALANENRDIRNQRFADKKNIKALEKRIQKLKKLEHKDIPMESQLPVKFIEQIEVASIPLIEDLQTLSIKLQSHALIYYQIYVLDTFMVVEIFEYNAVKRENARLLRTVVDPENVTQMYKSLQLSLYNAILGTQSTSLTIKALTKNSQPVYDAKILLDGDVVGFGEVSFKALPTGTHVISMFYNGTQRNEIVVLEEGQPVLKNFLYDITVEDTITINSNPTDARVYINSEWIGNTPTVVPKPDLVSQLEISMPGYQTHRISLNKRTNSVLDTILVPTNPIPLSERIVSDRKKFYNAFSMFAFSLALPVIFNGFYINESNANRYNSGLSAEGFAEANNNQTTYFYAYLGSTVVSAGFGVFTYIRLRKYLRTASEYQER